MKIDNSLTEKAFFVKVLGCQQNDHDGARIKFLLESLGLVEANPKDADLIIIVACSVRQTAVDRVFGNVKNWMPNSGLKNQRTEKLKNISSARRTANCEPRTIVITGCVLESDKKKLAEKGVKFWDIEKPEELAKILRVDDEDIDRLLRDGSKFSTSVPIMFGCNNFCTYCATAFTRGRERSRPMNEVINDVKDIIKKYCSSDPSENSQSSDFSLRSKHKNTDNLKTLDILLLGQTIDSYKDPEAGAGLDILFKNLNDLAGDFLISFTSNHPKDMTDDIIEAVATLPKIKKAIHLPLQSGSDKILKAMKRPYTVKEYLRLVKSIKLKVPKVNITTDIIVGFPGETEEDFQMTVDLMKKVKFNLAYINKYSPRPGTAAFKLGDPIPWSEKQHRWRILENLVNKP